jgi:hypothetical protein
MVERWDGGVDGARARCLHLHLLSALPASSLDARVCVRERERETEKGCWLHHLLMLMSSSINSGMLDLA